MKKLLILFTLLAITSCRTDIGSDGGIVTCVEINYEKGYDYKYKVTVQPNNTIYVTEKYALFTNSLYSIGDTIIFVKK